MFTVSAHNLTDFLQEVNTTVNNITLDLCCGRNKNVGILRLKTLKWLYIMQGSYITEQGIDIVVLRKSK